MKKTLFLSAILGAALCSTTMGAETITVDGTTYTAAIVGAAQATNPDSTVHAYLFNYSDGATYHANGTKNPWIGELTNADTLIFAGTDDGTYTPHGAFFDTGKNGDVAVNANILAGGVSDSDNELRFWTNGSYKVLLNNNLSLAGTQTNLWLENGQVDLKGKLIATESQVLRTATKGSGVLNLAGADLSQFAGSIKVNNGTVYAKSVTGLRFGNGSTLKYTNGVLDLQNSTAANVSTSWTSSVTQASDKRFNAVKNGNEITLTAGSENELASVTTTGTNGGWILVEAVGNETTGKYTNITLNSTSNGLVIKNGNTTAHIGALAGTATTATIRGDWGTGEGLTRHLIVHQDTDTTFAGQFIECTKNRDISLTKEGTGNLTLANRNGSRADLTVNGGVLTLAVGASWAGSTIVNDGGKLNILFSRTQGTETLSESANGFSTVSFRKTYGDKLTINGGTVTINNQATTFENGVLQTGTYTSKYFHITDASQAWDPSGATDLIVNIGSTNTLNFAGNNYNSVEILTIDSGVVTSSRSDGTGITKGDIIINGGGKLAIVGGGKDAFGYNGDSTKSITLTGTDADHKAVLDLSFNEVGGTTTMSGNIVMNGNAEISGSRGFNTFGYDSTRIGSITVSGTNNVISSELSIRKDATLTVNNGASLEISGTVSRFSGFSGILTKTGAGTLTITGAITGGAITGDGAKTIISSNAISGGTFQNVTFNNAKVNGTITLNNMTGVGTLQSALSGLSKSDAQGATSTINLGSGEYTFNADTTVNAHQLTFSGATQLNGYSYEHSSGHTITLENGAAINTGTNELKLQSKATLQVTDGSVTSGSIVLGHNILTNPGFLSMTGGSITTGVIRKNTGYTDTDNTFTMTGGTLTFTQGDSNALSGVQATITGGTLSTAQAGWQIDNANASIGGVTISGANAATLKNVSLSGAITALTDVTFEGAITYTGNGSTETVESFSGTQSGFGINTTTTTYTVLADGSTGAVTNDATWTVGGQVIDYANGALTTVSTATSNVWHIVGETSVSDVTAASIKVENGSSLKIAGTYEDAKTLDNSAGGTLELNGMTGWFAMDAQLGNVNIGKNGMNLTNGYQGHTTYINNLSGTGDIKRNGSGNGKETYAIDGTVDWSGSLIHDRSGKEMVVAFSASDVSFGGIESKNGTLNIESANGVTVDSVTLHGGTVTGVYTGSEHSEATESTLTTTTLVVEGNSTLNADLVVKPNGIISFAKDAVLTMGCGVEIGDGVTVVIDAELVPFIQSGTAVTIIDGIDADPTLTLGSGWNFVGTYGENLNGYGLALQAVDNGDSTWRVVVTPEPATATLSLLALAALCARRRRH